MSACTWTDANECATAREREVAGTDKPRPKCPEEKHHQTDADCTLDEYDSCTVCHVLHWDACPACDGRGFHKPGCSESDANAVVTQ